MESEQTPATALLALPVFPLFRAVLFPGVLIPLHIFETHYCAMVEQILSTDGMLALVMMQPGGEKDLQPALCEIGCLAKIVQSERLDGGGFNILVHGIVRVRLLEECAAPHVFRSFRVRQVRAFEEQAWQSAKSSLQRLESCVLSLGLLAQTQDRELVEVLRSRSDPLELGDVLSAILLPDCERQQLALSSACLTRRLDVIIDGMVETMARLSAGPNCARFRSN